MRERRVLTVDVERLRREADAIAAKIRASVVEPGKAAP